jgi:hypothetical protein
MNNTNLPNNDNNNNNEEYFIDQRHQVLLEKFTQEDK